MAPDPASRERVAALTAPDPSLSSPGPELPDPELPDPEFWGTEPRTVRRSRQPSSEEQPATRPEWWAALVDRARDARIEVGIGIVVVVVIALVAGVVWYRMAFAGGGAPPPRTAGSGARSEPAVDAGPVAIPAGATPVSVTTVAGTRATRGATVVVHVAGAVATPGVLLMPATARVIDAVEGAGGATAEADLDRLNLAAKLVDGQRILVMTVAAAAIADPGGATAVDPAALIDLNAATVAQLETLPGIGPTLAGAIVAERDRRGGFRSVNELREVRGIGDARFADVRDRVTV